MTYLHDEDPAELVGLLGVAIGATAVSAATAVITLSLVLRYLKGISHDLARLRAARRSAYHR